jgi:hypothetical protein
MPRVEALPKTRSAVFLRRAEDFEGEMRRAADSGSWNSVGLLGVHATISACDALTVHRLGQRWSGQDHNGLRELVGQLQIPGDATVLKQISDVLSLKNRVEYEAREFTRGEATRLAQQTSRILGWVREKLASR